VAVRNVAARNAAVRNVGCIKWWLYEMVVVRGRVPG